MCFTDSRSAHQWVFCGSCRSPHVCYFDDKLARCILPHLNLEIQPLLPLQLPPALIKRRNLRNFHRTQTHWVTFAFVCAFRLFFRHWVWILGSRGSVLWLAECNRVRQAEAGPPSHNSCSVIVASKDTVDFWEGTEEKYTSFSKLPAQAINTPKNRGWSWLSSCHSSNLKWLFVSRYTVRPHPLRFFFPPKPSLCMISVLSFEVMTYNVTVPCCKVRFVCGPAHTSLD